MGFTFGGATSDDINVTGPVTAGADNTASMVAGWWYPTTLTATRGYWSCGTTFGAEIDSTTSEIRMRTDNTTDGQWLTSGAGITTNKWWFIAWLNAAENTSVAGAWRVWVGDAETAPVEISVSNPTPRSGNYSGSTSYVVGNKGSTGTLAFQGDIGWVSWLLSSHTTLPNNMFNLAASGVIDQTEADWNLWNWVQPLWAGTPDIGRAHRHTTNWYVSHWNLDNAVGPLAYNYMLSTGALTPFALTVNEATYTINRPPRQPPHNWPNQWPGCRR